MRQGDEWSIELLRGFAALMVVAAHYLPHLRAEVPWLGSWLIDFSFTGVNLFFVLTGYVFAPQLMQGRIELAPFAVRRFFRLYPLYAVSLAVYLVIAAVQGRPLQHVGVHLLMLHTTESEAISVYYNPAYWSLPPEIEYYLLLPLLAGWFGTRSRLGALMLAALILHVLVAHHADTRGPSPSLLSVLSVHLPGLFIQFLFGIAAWRVSHSMTHSMTHAVSHSMSRGRSGTAVGGALIAAGIALWLAAAWGFAQTGTWPTLAPLKNHFGVIAALACALLVAGVTAQCRARDGRDRTLARLAVFAGALSYGVYLFHVAALQALSSLRPALGTVGYLALSLVATLIVAFFAHRAIEAPLREYGRRLARAIGLKPIDPPR